MAEETIKKVVIHGAKLSKIYKMGENIIRALDDIEFDIYEGEVLVILGPSGSGKSTLLNIVGGMDKPTEGELIFEGKALHKMNRRELTLYRRSSVGFIFQFYNLLPNLTALENVDIAREVSSSSKKSSDILNLVGLGDRMEHFPSQLSGGQQQRVAIARALVKDPKILLCDEPTGALDSVSSKEILSLLKDFGNKGDKTVIIITHNGNIAKMADRIVTIKDGKITEIINNEHPLKADEIQL